MTKITRILFSPTGGTKKVADILTKEMAPNHTTIDLTNASLDFETFSFEKEDFVLIAVPSYGGRVPAVAAQRISRIHGNGAKAVLVCVYGNRAYEDTLVELQDIAEQSGFTVVAAVCAIAEHSIMKQYATGRPDAKDAAQLKQFAASILEQYSAGNSSLEALPGNRPYKEVGRIGLVPSANSKCTSCGLCARECPVGAIDIKDVKHADKQKCISCMRCVAMCPQNARHVNKVVVSIGALAIKKACSNRKENELFLST